MYAILCQIAELPPKIRSSYKNIVPLMFIVGNCPNFNIIFETFLQKLKNTIENKVSITIEKNEFNIQLCAFVADAPARAKVLNINQFNGKNGCFHCLNPGINLSQKGNKRVYLTQEYPRRTNDIYRDQVDRSLRTKQTTDGIKCETYLSNWLKLPDACILDYMHLSFEGTVKSLLNIGLNSSNSQKEFYLGKFCS